ncbi:hypothetical protein [Siphonobacter curvatus]|uniref:ATP-binding protein n=1 Tax=Siphonobacter curvatus TaxID=2094562 RepID=A0A2S7IQI2_9BACT|nr:hypothetical protein [Siphonobacter curvatus]PQA59850.1 hypothetical protein C5O19_09570 [Siphonobacter curvatus]
MNPKIVINKNISYKDVDYCYEVLYNCIAKSITVDFELPSKFESKNIGMEIIILQLSITWSRSFKDGNLLINLYNNITSINNIYDNEILFPIITYAWNRHNILDNTGKYDLKGYLRVPNKEIHDKMLKALPLKGQKLLLTSFDHLPKKRGILPCFEPNGEYIENEQYLLENLHKSLYNIINLSTITKHNYSKVSMPIVNIIYELMKNTYEWAKTDENSIPLDPNIRGLYIQFIRKDRQQLIQTSTENPGLVNYFNSSALKENSIGELYLVEITVFDSGPGFIKKFESTNDVPNINKLNILKKCLTKHMTSDQSIYKDVKGLGLDRILRTLNNKGFLRIKTDELHIYRDLINTPYVNTSNSEDIDLFDWTSNEKNEIIQNYYSHGSVLSIIYPLS